jgi:MFS family permease
VFKNVYLISVNQALMMSGNSLQVTTAAIVGFSLAADKSLATLPLAAQFFAVMLLTIPASLIMKKFSRRVGFNLGVTLGVTGGSLAVFAIMQKDFWLFCMATFLIGSFNAFGTYYRFAAAETVDVDNQAKAISWVMVGGIFAALIGPNLANVGKDWVIGNQFAGSYAGLTALYIVSYIFIYKTQYNELKEEQLGQASRSLGVLFSQVKLKVALITGAIGYAVMTLVMTATPLSMKHNHLNFSDTSFVIQWHVLAMFAPSFFTGNLIKRFGVKKILLCGAMFELLCIMINLSGTTFWHYWVALFMLGIGWNFLFVGASVLITETYRPEERSKIQGLNDFTVFTILTIVSLSAGALQHQFGWQMVNFAVIPMVSTIIISIIWLFLYERKQGNNL